MPVQSQITATTSASGSAPGTPPAISLTGSHAVDMLIATMLMSAATWLANWAIEHLHISNIDLTTLAGMIFSVLLGAATALWVWINSKRSQATAVMSGINLAVDGGTLMQSTKSGQRTPVPVTVASAQQIIKDYGKVQVSVAEEPKLTDKLNAAELPPGNH